MCQFVAFILKIKTSFQFCIKIDNDLLLILLASLYPTKHTLRISYKNFDKLISNYIYFRALDHLRNKIIEGTTRHKI